MSNYFELDEFLRSTTAVKNGIQNYPGEFGIVDNLRELRDTVLNPLREDWGSAISVSSGYRCPKLNKLVGGSKTSVNMIGYAVDIVPANGDMDRFIEFCKNWFKDKNFDQVIVEKSAYKRWVHIGLYNNEGQQRKMLFNINL